MIPIAKPNIGKTAKKYVLECLDKNWISSGSFNDTLEKQFTKYHGVSYGVTCSNGTVALVLALKACGIGQGDEVIVPTLTFSATAASVVYANAKPIFADSDASDYNISLASIKKVMSPKVKAIIVVHLYGIPVDMEPIMEFARKNNIFVIEDAAEALTAEYQHKKIGTIGDIGCFSFYANKLVTTGEGGMCITQNKELYEKLFTYKNHGMMRDRVYWADVAGLNARMTNIQAAIGVSQMEDLPKNLKKRFHIFQRYIAQFGRYKLPVVLPNIEHSYSPWIFTFRAPGKTKEMLIKKLFERGIEARPGFNPCHAMPAFAQFVKKGQTFPVANEVSKELVSLPSFPGLTNKEIDFIVKTVADIISDK
ncbi:MAG: hypothetical protein RLZZ347_459 [Candidatus Parcubacteria bacterium]|jgi:perosamine synthetase